MSELSAAIDAARVWLEIEGVEAVGEGEEGGAPVVLVCVTRPQLRSLLPRRLRGFGVVVREAPRRVG